MYIAWASFRNVSCEDSTKNHDKRFVILFVIYENGTISVLRLKIWYLYEHYLHQCYFVCKLIFHQVNTVVPRNLANGSLHEVSMS